MKRICVIIFLVLLIPRATADEETSREAIRLNNVAVAAQNKMYRWRNNRIVGSAPNLKASDYKAIIDKYQAAHSFDPKIRLSNAESSYISQQLRSVPGLARTQAGRRPEGASPSFLS